MKAQQKRNETNTRASPGSDGQNSPANHAIYIRAFPTSDDCRRNATNMRLATWNIGSLTGRSQELAETLHRRNINICCIQELKWKGSKSRNIGYNYQLYYHGSSTKNGVGIVLDGNLKQRVIKVDRINDRIMCVKMALENQPCFNIISAYAPQTGCRK
ncbi:jg6307, partial [Pararge aegeria aegeria]